MDSVYVREAIRLGPNSNHDSFPRIPYDSNFEMIDDKVRKCEILDKPEASIESIIDDVTVETLAPDLVRTGLAEFTFDACIDEHGQFHIQSWLSPKSDKSSNRRKK